MSYVYYFNLNEFKKITPYNGFYQDTDKGRQNNYAWAMAELDDYIYVGTGRNLVYTMFANNPIGSLTPPEEFTPRNIDMAAEIWRYKKDGTGGWSLAYKVPSDSGIIGIRFMTPYTNSLGQTFLFGGCYSTKGNIILLRTQNGTSWDIIDTGITTGNSTRAMVVHKGSLYMSVVRESLESIPTSIYRNADPVGNTWELVTPPGEAGKNPIGHGEVMISFNDHLYVGTNGQKGFEVWRTLGDVPEVNKWKLIIDKGAGDASNVIPLTIAAFRDHVYVGTALHLGIIQNLNIPIPIPRGFDLVRIDKNDDWELVIGSIPIIPSRPTVGRRGLPISGMPSGFGVNTNGYCWKMMEYNGEFYLGTFDWSVMVEPSLKMFSQNKDKIPFLANNRLLTFIVENPFVLMMLLGINKRTYGFDLWKTRDGIIWTKLTNNGFGNPHNYGARNLFVSSNGNLYLGTANPFEGCEVWVKERSGSYGIFKF